jgi:hypothetical protein
MVPEDPKDPKASAKHRCQPLKHPDCRLVVLGMVPVIPRNGDQVHIVVGEPGFQSFEHARPRRPAQERLPDVKVRQVQNGHPFGFGRNRRVHDLVPFDQAPGLGKGGWNGLGPGSRPLRVAAGGGIW